MDDLTPHEIAEITGRKLLSAQVAELARRKIPFTFVGSRVKLSREVAMAFALVPERQSRAFDLKLVR